MFTKGKIRMIAATALAAIMILNIGLLVFLPSNGDTSEDDQTLLLTIDNGSFHTTFQPNSRKLMDWYGDQLFLTYVKQNETGALSAWLKRSPDGGDTWNDEIMIQNYTDCYGMKTDLHIHGDRLFLNLIVRNTTDWTTWNFHSLDVPVNNWNNFSAYNIARLDDVYQGFMPVPHTLSFGDKVFTFWVRSHYMDTIYRIWDNGTWGPSMFLDSGTYFSNMAPIVSNITGQETIHFIYSYYPNDKVYETISTDGLIWTAAKTLGTFPDSAVRISSTEHNGRIHIAVCENWDYDIWHASSKDDTIWTTWQKIGEVSDHYGVKEKILENSVVMASNDAEDSIYVGFDSSDGIKLVRSTDNGTSFSDLAHIKDENVSWPALDPKGELLLNYHSQIGLELWEIGIPDSEVPDPGNETDPGDGNETDPGDGNETDPGDGNHTDPGDGNHTDPGDGNETDPGTGNETDPGTGNETDPGTGNETDPGTGNETDPGEWEDPDDVPEPVENEPPGTPTIQHYPIVSEGKIVLSSFCVDPDGDQLNYTWMIAGIGIVGYGEDIQLELPPGRYQVNVVVTDPEGAISQYSTWIDMEETSDAEDSGSSFVIAIIVIALVIMLIFVLLLSGFFLRNRDNWSRIRERGSDLDVPNQDVHSTGSVPELYRPGMNHVQTGTLSMNGPIASSTFSDRPRSQQVAVGSGLISSEEDHLLMELEKRLLRSDGPIDLHRSGELHKKARDHYEQGQMSRQTLQAIERVINK